jgi:hydroxysqualene dehydroxylase
MKIAVVGGGWAGLAAAVAGVQAGHSVTLLEANRQLGGRARALSAQQPDGSPTALDNGQHILIGAYTETLRLMQRVGVNLNTAVLRLPLNLQFPDGSGLCLPHDKRYLPSPLDALAGICQASGWDWRDKLSLLRAALGWQLAGFQCSPQQTVATLCRALSPRIQAQLIEPLCVSALNTPADRASGSVFLRVLRDSLFRPGHPGMRSSNLLLPRVDLGKLFPDAAAAWLGSHQAQVLVGQRVVQLNRLASGWQLVCYGEPAPGLVTFDHVILACPAQEAARLVAGPTPAWAAQAQALQYEAIATVYVNSALRLPAPMISLRSSPTEPAQFVFDRGQLGGPKGLLAFVVSASQGSKAQLEKQVLTQALALGWRGLVPLQTVVEKRATFACTPGLQRPPQQIASGLLACGDYVQGPYPSTLEAAVRSGVQAVQLIETGRTAR